MTRPTVPSSFRRLVSLVASGLALHAAGTFQAAVISTSPSALLPPALAIAGLTLAGCGGGGESGGDAAGDAAGSVKKYDRSKLPKTTQELPPLDQGRVEVPTPTGWEWRSQEKSLLARFHQKGRSGMPQIIVKLDDESPSEIADVTADNVEAYAAAIQASLDAKGTRVIEPSRPLLLGGNAWARYVQPGKLPNKKAATIERQILKTTRGGRTYIVELQVPIKELKPHRDHAYAVAAGMKFTAGGSAPAGETNAPEAAPAAAPAEPAAKPAE